MRLGRTALLAGALVVAGAGPAQAAKPPTIVEFKMTLKGTQERTWSRDHTQYDPCISGETRTVGSGTSTMRFASSKPFKLRALRSGRTVALVPASRTRIAAPVAGSLAAEGTETHTQLSGHPPECGGSANPAPPPPPDCGTKSFTGEVGLRYYTPDAYPEDPAPLVPVLQLDGISAGPGTSGFAASDLFRRCPTSETGEILRGPSGSLPLKLLFGGKRSFKVKGRDSAVTDVPDRHDEVTTTWTATFKRGKVISGGGGTGDGPTACDDGRDNDRDGKVDFPKDPDCKSRADRKE